jgi:hypothetical protein
MGIFAVVIFVILLLIASGLIGRERQKQLILLPLFSFLKEQWEIMKEAWDETFPPAKESK